MRLPLTLVVHRSRTLILALIAAHALVATGSLLTDLPILAKVVLAAVLSLSLFRALRPGKVVSLVLKGDGCISLVLGDGNVTDCQVDQATTVFRWLVVLRLTDAAGLESLVLPVDATGAEGHRQLRLWLRWRASVA